jgi:hypothetical protein
VALLLPVLILGCQSALEANQNQKTVVAQLPRYGGWQAHSANPIIQAGDFIDKGLWNDPHVLKENGRYIMYLTSSSPQNPFKPPVLPYRAISNDGIAWHLEPKTPLLDVSNTTFVSVETPSVVKFNGLYHLFYTGVYPKGALFMFAIGHATSKDGIHWNKDAKEALKPTGKVTDWNGFIVGEPGAVVYRNTLLVYFSAAGQKPDAKPPLSQVIGYVSSTDGKTFSAPKIALQLSSIYPQKDNYCGYSTPSAVVHRDKIHLFHDVAVFSSQLDPNWQQVALSHSVSSDGGLSFTQDKAPIFVRNDFNWTGGEIRAPSALFEDGQVKLWFAGMVPVADFRPMIAKGIKGREFGIGYATISASSLGKD